MASKAPTTASEPEAVQQPAAEPESVGEKVAEVEQEVVEHVEEAAEAIVAEVEHLAQFIPMIHGQEGGSSDSFEKNAEGHLMVPVAEVETALAHGLVPVEG